MAVYARGQAPSPTGNLHGTVRDAQGASISGVTVSIRGPGAPQTANSNEKGDFHFLNLSPGAYSVRLERSGFEVGNLEVEVLPGRNALLAVELSVAGAAEAVRVEAGGFATDSRRIVTGATFGRKELESVPTTRDPWAVLRQVPGVLIAEVNVGGDRHPRQQTFVGKGSRPDQNSYNLDGVGISQDGVSPLYYDFDSLDGIEVTTGGSDPSLATPGVTVNLVTRRRTNQLRGSARALDTGTAGWDYGIESGGPLWKDHLWLWGAASRISFLGRTFLAAGEPVRDPETLKHWNGKLNASFLPGNTLTVSYTHFGRVVEGRGADSETSLEATGTKTFGSRAFRVEDSHVLSANLFASISLSSVKANPRSTPRGGIDEQADYDADGVLRHSNTRSQLHDTQRQAGLTTSAFFDTGNLRHELKFGFGYRHARLESASTWPGDLLVGYGQFGLAAVTRGVSIKSQINSWDALVGDTIQLENLTVNLGARFDYQQGKNRPSAVSANPVFPELLPAVQFGGDHGYPITWRQVQPRVGTTYAFGRDRRTLARVSYSRFVNQLGNGEVRWINAFPVIAQLGYLWNDDNGNGRVERGEIDLESGVQFSDGVDPDEPGSFVPINRISGKFKPPTTDELIVGVERRISPDFSGTVAYTYRVVRNIESFPLIGTSRASYQYFGTATGTATSADGFALDFSVPYYGLTECPEPCAGALLQNRPDARETYSGVELQLLKALSHGWMARVSFGYNDWRQHLGRDSIVDPTESSGTFPVVEGIINSTWQFNVSGMVELPLGVAAGVNLFGRQGFPIQYFVEVVTHDAEGNRPDILIGKATRYRTPDVYQLDLQLSKAFRIGSKVTVTPQVDCFNVFDSRTVLRRDGLAGTYDGETETFVGNGRFDRVDEVLSHRVFRGGVRVAF